MATPPTHTVATTATGKSKSSAKITIRSGQDYLIARLAAHYLANTGTTLPSPLQEAMRPPQPTPADKSVFPGPKD